VGVSILEGTASHDTIRRMTTSSTTDTIRLPATDREALTRLERFGGVKLLNEMIALFLESAPGRLSTAQRGLERGDAPTVEDALHSLKSSSAQLGAPRLSRLCEQGESVAHRGRLDGMGALLQDCRDELGRVEAWLTTVRAQRSA
jgi:HPt (histidine-containing phosphotransfer) domain-containing protein